MSDPGRALIEVSGLQPEAQPVARRAAQVYIHHIGANLVSLIVHGSGVKGGLIPGSSDLDFAIIVAPGCLTVGGELPLERALRLHRDLAQIDPSPFRYLQAFVFDELPEHRVGFIPGTYAVVHGSPNVPVATNDELIASARRDITSLDTETSRNRISNALLDHGEGRLHRQVRLLCTEVWPLMYQVACLLADDLTLSWQRTKGQVVDDLAGLPGVGPTLRQWWRVINDHYANGETNETALAALWAGVEFMEAVASWGTETLS